MSLLISKYILEMLLKYSRISRHVAQFKTHQSMEIISYATAIYKLLTLTTLKVLQLSTVDHWEVNQVQLLVTVILHLLHTFLCKINKIRHKVLVEMKQIIMHLLHLVIPRILSLIQHHHLITVHLLNHKMPNTVQWLGREIA